MLSQAAEIVNKLGLHARAAAKLTHIASGFQSEIWLSRSGRRVNAKSIMGVMMLAAGQGSTVLIEAAGDDAEQAIRALQQLIAQKFGEDEVEDEVRRFEAGLRKAREELQALKAHIPADSPPEFEAFLNLHRMILD